MHTSEYPQIGKPFVAHQVPSGILTGLLKDSNSKLIHPVVVLMKLLDEASVMLSG